MSERRPRDGALLVIKTGEPPPAVLAGQGDFEHWIARGLGRPLEALSVVSVYRGEALPEPESVEGVVVTGSPEMVSDRAPWSEAAAGWLARVVERDAMPVLGLCYGHQLIAHGLGGEVGTNPRGREMGTVEVRFDPAALEQDPVFAAGRFPGHMSHLESVLRAPADARVLARTDLEPHAALRFGPRQWGVQFHPEFDREIMRAYIAARREALEAEGLDPAGMIAAADDTPALTHTLRRFADLVSSG